MGNTRQVQSARFRKMLLEKRTTLLAGSGLGFTQAGETGPLGEEDQARLLQDESVSVRLNRLEYAQLRMIEEALDRVETGDYGNCCACDQPIPAKRLEALPWAKYCVPCQQEFDAVRTAALDPPALPEHWRRDGLI